MRAGEGTRYPPPMLLALVLSCAPLLQDPHDAKWIWGSWAEDLNRPDGEICAFRREVKLARGVEEAVFTISVDNAYVVWINGERIGRDGEWETALRYDVADHLTSGTNVIEVTARNQGGPAGLFAFLTVKLLDGSQARVSSDETWMTRRRREGEGAWEPAKVLASYGEDPWGQVSFSRPGAPKVQGSVEIAFEERFEPLPGFTVTAAWESMESFIALESIDEHRVLAATEAGGIVELVDEDGDGNFDSEASFTEVVTYCQGLLWHEDQLYCTGRGPDGPGLYVISPDKPGFAGTLGLFTGSTGEHGPHAVVAGPDGALYLSVGNHAGIKADWSPTSTYPTFYEGHLLPRYVDPRGHANKIEAPGGIVVRYDAASPEEERWQVMAGGFRNAYDLAFNAAGHLFTFDSDMEWDLGLPWYREVRLVHVVPGGEYGWRTGSTKWPSWYPDSLPPIAEVGRGSPTGVTHYGGDMFPTRYQGAILAGDWSRGRILAFFLTADGLTYKAESEELLLGRGLNVSDLDVAPDGSLLISTGGRGGSGSLLRLSYEGDRGPAHVPSLAPKWLSIPDRAPLGEPFSMVDFPDRTVRYAAARILEQRGFRTADLQGVSDHRSVSEGLVVAARVGFSNDDPEDCALGIERATALALVAEGDPLKAGLRALDLFLQDPDAPPIETLGKTGRALLRRFPTGDQDADRELALLLAHLEPLGTVPALVGAMKDEPSRAGQMHLAYALRAVATGWDDASREAVAGWLAVTDSWDGGYSLPGYLKQMRRDFEELFGPEYAELFEDEVAAAKAWTPPDAYGGTPWSTDEILAYLAGAGGASRRDAAEGAIVFEASCARCHPLAGGGSLGPDLEGVTGRFTRADLLSTIISPSRVVPEAYQAVDVFLNDGTVHSGLPIEDTEAALTLSRSDGTSVEIDPADIYERRPSPLSTMPEALLHGLTLEEVGDLFHYLEVGGERDTDAITSWTKLFDGKSLDGWEYDPGHWTIDDGILFGGGDSIADSSFLISKGEWSDFIVEFDIRIIAGNSGLQFRATRTEGYGLDGYQADAGETFWGSLYEEGGRGMLHKTPDVDWVPSVAIEGWNHFVVTADGDRLIVEVNGTVMSDLRDGALTTGRLGFQLHPDNPEIQLRNVRVRQLQR